jgi:hypothetical protein
LQRAIRWANGSIIQQRDNSSDAQPMWCNIDSDRLTLRSPSRRRERQLREYMQGREHFFLIGIQVHDCCQGRRRIARLWRKCVAEQPSRIGQHLLCDRRTTTIVSPIVHHDFRCAHVDSGQVSSLAPYWSINSHQCSVRRTS